MILKRESALENDAIRKIEPQYPPNAITARVQGEVKVEVVIDEKGDVISAKVVAGDPLLHDSSLIAARQWAFKPSSVAGKPVKGSGILTFRYVLNDQEANKDSSTGERGPNPDPAADLIKQGGRLSDEGKVEEAIGKYREALSIKPDHAQAYYYIGLAYLKIKRFNDAETSCVQAVNIRLKELQRGGQGERDMIFLYSMQCLGLAQSNLGKTDDAIGSFRRVTELDKQQHDAWTMLGNLLERKGDHEAAIAALKESIAAKPEPPAFMFLGHIHLRLNQFKEAIDYFKKAIELKNGPHIPSAHFVLGSTYLKIGDKQSAMAEYQALKKIDNERAEKLLNMINN